MLKRSISAQGVAGNKWLFDADNRKLHSDGSEQTLRYAVARLQQDGQFAAAAFLEDLEIPTGFPSCGFDDEVAQEIVDAVNTAARALRMNEHIHTDKCGFDRNSSHLEGTYVCECGWRETPPPGLPDTPRQAMTETGLPQEPEYTYLDIESMFSSALEYPCKCGEYDSSCHHCSAWERAVAELEKLDEYLDALRAANSALRARIEAMAGLLKWTVLFNDGLGRNRCRIFCADEEVAEAAYLILQAHARVPTKRPYHPSDSDAALKERTNE